MTTLPNRYLYLGLFTVLTACGGSYTTPVSYQQDSLGEEDKENTSEDEEWGGESSEDNQGDPNEETFETEDEEDVLQEEDASCTYDNFNVAGERAFVVNASTDQPIFVFQATDSGSSPMNVLEILSYPGEPYHGPNGVGTYSMDGNNYEDCSLCMLIYEHCGESSCESVYFADLGELQVNSAMEVNQNFSATLRNVVFKEVSIDQETYRSTPIDGGNTWCVDSLTIGAIAEEYSN